jgi:hypothetical protein
MAMTLLGGGGRSKKISGHSNAWAALRTIARLAMLCATAALLTTCWVEPVTFRQLVAENCDTAGDEDGNGRADCDDPSCAAAKACAPASCTDQIKNGNETDLDCGGACAACGDGATCGGDRDCGSGLCGAATCVRLSSCAQILSSGLSRGDGTYSIDPDGVDGQPAFLAKCDMTSDGGGWTRFHWVTGPYPANLDPLEQALSQCSLADAVCRARIPAAATPTSLMVKDLGDGDIAQWRFDPQSAVSNAVLGALRDKTVGCVAGQTPWQPYFYSGTETFCGTGGEGGCASFVYVDTAAPGCGPYTGWYVQLDGDTGCYNAAFKIGMTHAGYEDIGCERPEANYLDDGPTTLDDNTGELYYR